MSCIILLESVRERNVHRLNYNREKKMNFCDSVFFDSDAFWNSSHPELSSCFQKTAILWPPCVFLILLLPFRIYYLSRCYIAPIPFNAMNVTKTILAAIIAILSLTDLYGASQDNSAEKIVPAVNFVSPIVQCFTMVGAIVLIHKERVKGVKSSSILSMFWLIFLVSETIICYSTLAKTYRSDVNADTFQSVISVLTLLLTLGEFILILFVDNRPNSNPSSCPEEDATFFSKITSSWFFGMIYKGNTKSLTQEDIYSMKTDDASANVIAQFVKYWNAEIERLRSSKSDNKDETNGELTKQSKTPNLLWTLVKAFWPWLLTSVMFTFSMTVLNFATPVIIKLMMNFIENKGFLWQGYMYAVIMFVAKSIRSLLDENNNTNSDRLSMRARTSVLAILYRKIMTLSNSARRNATAGEVINIMSVDTDRFIHLTWYWTHFWSAPIQIILALVFLWNTLGYSVLCGTLVMAVVIPIHGWLAKYTRANEVEQRKLKDSRIKLMNEILNGVKVLKLYAWEKSFEKQILEIRNKEIEMMRKSSYLHSIMSFIWHLAPFLLSFVTFAVYLLSDPENVLDAEKTFVALSLLELLRGAMGHLPHLMTELIPVSVALKRVQTFLENDDLNVEAISQDCSSENAITIENADFKWEKEGESALKNINFEVPEGSLVAVVGVVGSGKSSLLSAILGEMDKVSGHATRKGSVAYVAQQAWIQNTTLRKNVLFGSSYEKTTYDNVIEACSLRSDLDLLEGGDLTEIGEKGINLSGGQKQRVSLARAVYQDADIYLLDDPLSAVDAHVGKHIFENIIGSNGLLKEKTRVLVTHGTKYLSQADKIIVLVEGKISEVGTYKELMTHKGAFSEFLKTYAAKQGKTSLDDSGISSESSSEDESKSEKVHGKKNKRKNTPETKSEKQEEYKTMDDETIETGQVGWSVYWTYLKSVGPIIGLYLVTLLIWNASHMYSNVLLSDWSSDGTNGTTDTETQKWRLGAYGAAGITHGLMSIALEIVKIAGLIMASKKLHSSLLTNVLRSPMSFFDRTPLGRIINRFSKDIDFVDRNIPHTFAASAMAVWEIVAIIGLIAYGQPLFLVVIIPMAACYYFVQKYFISTARQLRRIESSVRSPKYSHYGETISGVTTIRAFGQQERFTMQAQNIVETLNKVSMNCVYCYRWLGIRMTLLSNTFLAFASIVIIVISRDTMSSGVAGLILAYSLDLTHHLMWMAHIACELETNIISVERINEYSETPREAEWNKEDSRPEWPEQGAVKFNDYGMRYKEDQYLILKGISCEINAGEKVGIAGRTGAGKSSLTMALFRIIEGAKGSIEIDGVDISTLGLHNLRSKLTIIPQEPVLFSGSLRMNLDPFNAYTDEQIWRALEHAHLDKFVLGLADGLNHECAEGGENISVGQRQLVCLARALLRKTKILILDEATAAVDMEMDDLIQKTIRNEFSDCTIMTIAHRLNTIMDYTRVMVLDAGKIAEFDSPQTLLQDNSSIFYGMARDAGLVK